MNTAYAIKVNGVILADTYRSVSEAYDGAEFLGLAQHEWHVVKVVVNGDTVAEVEQGNPFNGAASGVW